MLSKEERARKIEQEGDDGFSFESSISFTEVNLKEKYELMQKLVEYEQIEHLAKDFNIREKIKIAKEECLKDIIGTMRRKEQQDRLN